MMDLTGDYLLTFLLREIKDIVQHNPRFRRAGGDAVAAMSNGVMFGDVKVTVSSVSSSGTRLSPDYFMYTQKGRSVLGKVPNKQGAFLEWINEEGPTYLPGIYYVYVDAVDERSREVRFLVRTFKWASGNISSPAQGSYVYFSHGINARNVLCSDPTVGYDAWENRVLLKNLPGDPEVTWSMGDGTLLTPMRDYWVLRESEAVLCPRTLGGPQVLTVPFGAEDFSVLDNTGYCLRPGVDYEVRWGIGSLEVILGEYTPPNTTLTIKYLGKHHPSNPVHPENRVNFMGEPILETCWLKTSAGTYDHTGMRRWEGQYWLQTLLTPGSSFGWDVKVDAGDTTVLGSKQADNRGVIPGLSLAIGDMVEVGDEAAIIVYPDITETYEVFGSTDNLQFTLGVTANDKDTVSDLSAAIKAHLLVKARDRHEACGVTIYQMSSSSNTDIRDGSGIHTSTTREFSVDAAADWKVFIPLVNRVSDIDISDVEVGFDFPGNVRAEAYGSAMGFRGWVKPSLAPNTPPEPLPPTPVDPGTKPPTPSGFIPYGEDMQAMCPVCITPSGALPCNSGSVEAPWVDAITLVPGKAGDLCPVASVRGAMYDFPQDLPGMIGSLLYLTPVSTLSEVVPTVASGYQWCVPVGRKVGPRKLMFMTFPPIQIL